ncbi:HdeD family acid-resistance protein [Nocardiopsis sediminis]|uniref:HdeD family acid-resistance protein n=1 Tax=Nocardiopsis sediminis TaxID=1778267 RepID=A0ABV8FUK4_9ACTN
MLDYLVRHWWVLILRGAIAIVFGLLAVVWPAITLVVLAILFGFYALVDGAMAGVAAFRAGDGSRGPLVVEAVLGVLFGIVALLWPGFTVLALALVIGAWAVVTGVFEVAAAVRLRKELAHEWLYVVSGVLSIAFGIVIWFIPGVGLAAVALLIGVYAILFGAVLIALGLRVRAEGRNRGIIA